MMKNRVLVLLEQFFSFGAFFFFFFFLNKEMDSSHCGSLIMNPASIHEDAGLIPGHVQAMSCGLGCGHGLDWALLWLWCRLAAAALI